jgi:hypothetical protein
METPPMRADADPWGLVASLTAAVETARTGNLVDAIDVAGAAMEARGFNVVDLLTLYRAGALSYARERERAAPGLSGEELAATMLRPQPDEPPFVIAWGTLEGVADSPGGQCTGLWAQLNVTSQTGLRHDGGATDHSGTVIAVRCGWPAGRCHDTEPEWTLMIDRRVVLNRETGRPLAFPDFRAAQHAIIAIVRDPGQFNPEVTP